MGKALDPPPHRYGSPEEKVQSSLVCLAMQLRKRRWRVTSMGHIQDQVNPQSSAQPGRDPEDRLHAVAGVQGRDGQWPQNPCLCSPHCLPMSINHSNRPQEERGTCRSGSQPSLNPLQIPLQAVPSLVGVASTCLAGQGGKGDTHQIHNQQTHLAGPRSLQMVPTPQRAVSCRRGER